VDGARLSETLITIQTAFVEMPELRLTLSQAQRFWALPQDVCEAALNALIERRFLVRTPERVYLRRSWWSFRGETDPAALTT
jgi:hypothetical protein